MKDERRQRFTIADERNGKNALRGGWLSARGRVYLWSLAFAVIALLVWIAR